MFFLCIFLVTHKLVSSKELELKDLEEEKRKQFMFDCIKLAEPELLPIPTATSNSEIFDVHKVRDVSKYMYIQNK